MTDRVNMQPAHKVLLALTEPPEVEHYAIQEIESLPLDVVKERLLHIGLDPEPPGKIKLLFYQKNTPAQQVLDALNKLDYNKSDLESMNLEEVHAVLNQAGVNYRAGLARAQELVAAKSPQTALSPQAINSRNVVAFGRRTTSASPQDSRKFRRSIISLLLYTGIAAGFCCVCYVPAGPSSETAPLREALAQDAAKTAVTAETKDLTEATRTAEALAQDAAKTAVFALTEATRTAEALAQDAAKTAVSAKTKDLTKAMWTAGVLAQDAAKAAVSAKAKDLTEAVQTAEVLAQDAAKAAVSAKAKDLTEAVWTAEVLAQDGAKAAVSAKAKDLTKTVSTTKILAQDEAKAAVSAKAKDLTKTVSTTKILAQDGVQSVTGTLAEAAKTFEAVRTTEGAGTFESAGTTEAIKAVEIANAVYFAKKVELRKAAKVAHSANGSKASMSDKTIELAKAAKALAVAKARLVDLLIAGEGKLSEEASLTAVRVTLRR